MKIQFPVVYDVDLHNIFMTGTTAKLPLISTPCLELHFKFKPAINTGIWNKVIRKSPVMTYMLEETLNQLAQNWSYLITQYNPSVVSSRTGFHSMVNYYGDLRTAILRCYLPEKLIIQGPPVNIGDLNLAPH